MTIQNGKALPGRQYTVAEFSEEWMENHVRICSLSPVTVDGYRRLLDSRIIPALGNVRLHELSPMRISRFYRELQASEGRGGRKKGGALSSNAANHYHRVLRAMLNTAVMWGVIPLNPVKKVTPPRDDAKPIQPYDAEQARQLLKKLEGNPLKHQVGVLLGLIGQLRKGEVAGLNWTDIDFDRKTIRIERSSVYVNRSILLKDTKTKAGKRTICVPSYLISLLRSLEAEQNTERLKLGETWVESGAVFVQWNGARQHPDWTCQAKRTPYG